MKATNLRLGNIVALIDQPENPDRVLMLEPRLVHLMNRDEADDENNIIGVPMSKEIIENFQIPLNSWHLKGKTNVFIDIIQDKDQVILNYQGIKRKICFLHEIQNLILELTGEDLIKHPIFTMREQANIQSSSESNSQGFRIIRQPYRIAMARWKFTVLQKRILTRIISAMQREITNIEQGTPIEQLKLFMTSENTIELTIPLNGLVKNSNNYTSVKKSLQQLRNLDVEICLPYVKGSKKQPEQELILTGLIEREVMRKHSRTITLTMHKATAAELIKVSHGLTCFSEEIMFMTDNPYTQKLYEIICHWKDKSVFTFSIDQFRKWMMIENKYHHIKDIIKHLIRPAEKELQEIGDMVPEI